jgi:hypothetical protein
MANPPGFNSKEFAVDAYKPQPIPETIWPILSKLDLKPLTNYKGVDLTDILRIKKPLMEASILVFHTDKIEKLMTGFLVFMRRMAMTPLVIIPKDDYDFPMLGTEYIENPGRLHFLFDMHPLRDIVVEPWYREKYLDPFEPIWKEYIDLHNDINPNIWFRAMLSPFPICCRQEPKNSDRSGFSRATEFLAKSLEYYINNVIPKAEPITNPQAKQYIVKRKNMIRETFRTMDPGGGPLAKTLGIDLAKKVLLALF